MCQFMALQSEIKVSWIVRSINQNTVNDQSHLQNLTQSFIIHSSYINNQSLEYQRIHMLVQLFIITIALFFKETTPLCVQNQRCCELAPTCNANYCTQNNQDTWNSTEAFSYTKLVMIDNKCLPCAYDCKACTSQTSCNTCATDFYQSSSSCSLCSDRCQICAVANSISRCKKCQRGAYLDADTSTCKSCPTGATQCSTTSISSCDIGYRLTSNSLFCTKCPENCDKCAASDTFCQTCSVGYYRNTSLLCSSCITTGGLSNCKRCFFDFANSKAKCLVCASKFYVNQTTSKCVACPLNCLTCSTTAICTLCEAGFYTSGGGCATANSVVTNCESYSTPSACLKCISGYYLSSNKCLPCSILCTTCHGRHFGACTACDGTIATLFNLMCLPTNFPSETTFQNYFSIPHALNRFSGGSLKCSDTLYVGTIIRVVLSDLSAYQVNLKWKIYSVGSTRNYQVSLNSSANQKANFSTSSNVYSLCSQDYYLSIQQQNFTEVKLSNSLTFSGTGGQIAIEQLLVTAKRCSSLCLECSETKCNNCLTSNLYTQDAYCVYLCSSGYFTYQAQKTCVKECPLASYGRSTDITCQPCVQPCYSCLNDKVCLTCISGYYLSNDGTCVKQCPYRYYARDTTQTCQKCIGRCMECISDTQCVSCRVGFLQSSDQSCVDQCLTDGFYSDIKSLSCKACDSTCLTCALKATRCLTCQPTRVFYDNLCVTACPDGYYNNSGVCTVCSYPCQNCITSSTMCTSCVDRYLKGSSCLSSCGDGYYQENVKLQCLQCHSNCTKCIFQNNYCLQCANGFFLFGTQCLSICPDRFYGSSSTKICEACSNICQTCSNLTFCLSCSANFLTTSSGQCVSASLCPKGTYADIKNLKCLPCQSPCATCQFQATKCKSCISSSSTPLLEKNKCVASCSSQLFYASTAKICESCEPPCVTCLNQTACLSCISGYKYSNNVCSSTCSVGTFYDIIAADCTPCSSNCLTCNSATFCQLCATNFYIQSASMTSAKCVSQCSDGSYNDPLSLSCQECLFPCQNCQSSIDCLSCQEGVLYNQRCIAVCPDSTYQSVSTCLDCGGNCLTCVNDATTCKLCKDGFFLKGTECIDTCPSGFYEQDQTQMCLSCPKTCAQCSNSTFCTSCIPNRTYLNSDTNLCVYFCPSGKFGNSTTQICQNCNPKCMTCNATASNCLTCATTFLLIRLNSIQFSCQQKCPQFYYQEGSVCYPCLFPCKNCTSSITCTSCVVGTVFHSLSSSCLHSCPLQTYSFNETCVSCKSPCVTCANDTYCLSCKNNLYVHNGNCVATCPSAYYPESSKICNQCYGFCKTCTSKFYCITCHAGYAFDGYCYSSCPIGSYADTDNGICIACQSPCLECSISPTYCTRCSAGLFVYRGNCSAICPSSTYIDIDDQQCVTCTRPCQTCQNQFSCKSCLGGYLLYLNKSCIENVDKCPNDYYKKDSIECVPVTWCPDNYLIDDDLRTCSKTCNVGKYTDITNKKCLTSCPPGFYSGINLVCENYQTNPPVSLLGSSAIAFIKSSRMHLVVTYNQSVVWSENSDDLYSVKAQQTRLLQTTATTFTNTLASGSPLEYTTVGTDELQVKLQNLPYRANINLPAYYVSSTQTQLPLQTPQISTKLPEFFVYTHQQIYTGSLMGQFSEGITWLILLISLIFLFINRLSDLYVLWDTAQLLYVLIFLNIQYPPPLNQFFLGMSGTHLNFIPSLFTVSKIRNVSALPFYAYSYDNSFLRTAGHSILLMLVFLIIYIFFKIAETLMKKVQKIKQFVQERPMIKKFVYRGLLRYRWHHTSDLFFTTYLNVTLFAIAQIYFISENLNNYFSNVLAVIMIIIYTVFPIFVGYKLYKHFGNISRGKLVNNLKCFYRGIQKDNKFGISIILIRYVRKFAYALIISIFSMTPLYALPMLMFSSVLFAIFIFANKPYKKRLSNIITIITQVSLVIVFAIIAVIQFLSSSVDSQIKQGLGWACCFFLVFTLLALIYELFCKTLFYLEPQDSKKNGDQYDPLKDEKYIRQKAGEFFDLLFPQLKKGFNLDDSQDQFFAYEEGDSQNSENNDLREQAWGLDGENSENFKHYAQSESSNTDMESRKKIPNLLIRVAKQI